MRGTATVIGGGIGGLTVANYLVRAGWEVRVHERADGPPATGTALGMWPQALAALDEVGLGDQVRARGVPQSSGTILRPDGSTIARVAVRGGTTRLISRPALLRILAEPASRVLRYGSAVTGPAGYTSDVVIGADGINSRVRHALFDDRRPRPLRMAAWRGWTPGNAVGACETWGEGALFGTTPRDGDLTNFFAAVRIEPGALDGGIEFLRAKFGAWHPGVREILDRLDPAAVLHHDLYDSPALPSYVRGNVALIGDAAHAMAPNLGRGACEAIVDGVALGRALTESPDVAGALRRYDRARRLRTRMLVRASATMARVATAGRGRRVRDGALGLVTMRR
ncbi:FAD-dependent monooxygenase [Rhodococcus sp. NPDC127528]|uniref:FAD-dependent monooxygenase n=1 Tax=unclassified Rhodococcus (in: high G+C Gram-positive bacteria) TaxID=192944 RepID=UPI00362F26D4